MKNLVFSNSHLERQLLSFCQLEEVKAFVEESNKRIVELQAEAEQVRATLPIPEMTMEEFFEAYPDQAINIDKPTIWPHIPEEQPGDEPEKKPDPEDH